MGRVRGRLNGNSRTHTTMPLLEELDESSLWEAILPFARRAAKALTSEDNVDDFCQFAALRVLLERKRWNGRVPLMPYLKQRVQWELMERQRRWLKRDERLRPFSQKIEQNLERNNEFAEVENAEGVEDAVAILQQLACAARISGRDYLLWKRRVIDGWSWEEIADSLGLRSTNAQVRYSNSRHALKRALEIHLRDK